MQKTLWVIAFFVLTTSSLSCSKTKVAPRKPTAPTSSQERIKLPLVKKKVVVHPQHKIIVWTTTYKGRIFRVIKLPRCEHVEVIMTYQPQGETKEQAKKRLNGFAASSAAFYDPNTRKPVDYFRRNSVKITGREQGRWFLAILPDGGLEISNDHSLLEKSLQVNALALGQRLVPFHHDGFSVAFANAITERMALGFSLKYLYIVQAKTDLWRLGQFIQTKLYCDQAINTDGGHSVKGKSPFHLVFRWQTDP